VCAVIFYLVNLFEKLPEWVRWILYLPMLALAIGAGNLLSYTFLSGSEGSWLWWRMLCDFGGITASIWFTVYMAGALAPRFKAVAATLILVAFLALAVFGLIMSWDRLHAQPWGDSDYLDAEKLALWLVAGPMIWWTVIQSLELDKKSAQQNRAMVQQA
jgi:hypothetical protein